MSLYWLRPEWTEAGCGNCGQNIHASGGDPDWGLCWPCMEHQTNLAQAHREYERGECERCCGNGQTYGPNSGEDIVCPDCAGTGHVRAIHAPVGNNGGMV